VHELAAYALLALVAFHIAAALWHQFIKRDGLMTRMSFSASPLRIRSPEMH
jgi:cytochrome b561